jgi:hypothetical protein
MGEPLICPVCMEGTMRWNDPDAENLLEEGTMRCRNCGAEFRGIIGWLEAKRLELGRKP